MIRDPFTGAWFNADGAGGLEFVLHAGKLFVSDNGAFRGRVLRVDTVNGAWYLPQTTALVVTADDGPAVSGRLKLVHLFPLAVGYPGAPEPLYKLPGQSGDVWWHRTTAAGNNTCDGWESVYPAVAHVRQLVNALNAAPYPSAPPKTITAGPKVFHGKSAKVTIVVDGNPIDVKGFNAEHVAYDTGAQDNRYPHICPRCGDPAYIGLNNVDCSGGCT